ncbi:MAG: 2'-5' RNA ligase family protein [Nanoarchaeota archaeon]|nr:2'-5' RNA ligase family protein [Nanoarchaeota archaeon]
MDKYHIGTRARGFVKEYLREIKNDVDKEQTQKKYVPHMTLIRPFTTKNETRLIETFENFCSQQKELIPFTIEDFDAFYNPERIFYVKIRENQKLVDFINSLETSLIGKIKYIQKEIKEDNGRTLHLTISQGIPDFKVFRKLNKQLPIDQYLLRVYLLKNKLILREYDFPLERMLTRDEAKNDFLFKETINAFTEKTGLVPSQDGFIRVRENIYAPKRLALQRFLSSSLKG